MVLMGPAGGFHVGGPSKTIPNSRLRIFVSLARGTINTRINWRAVRDKPHGCGSPVPFVAWGGRFEHQVLAARLLF